MITLNIDLTTESEREHFDPDNMEYTIGTIEFDNFIDFNVYLMCEMNARDQKVYILGYGGDEDGGDEDGIVFIDHLTCNILDNVSSHLRDVYEGSVEDFDMNVFLFAQDNYNDAYRLAIDLKETTGMLDFQIETDKPDPTVSNGGIKVTQLPN